MRKCPALILLVGKFSLANGVVRGAKEQNPPSWFVLLNDDGSDLNRARDCGRCEKKGVQCGGTLIAQDMVLTSAHCFDQSISQVACDLKLPDTAWVGREAMCSEHGYIGKAFDIQTLYHLDQYNPKDEFNLHDLAIIKLKEKDPSSPNRGAISENTVFATYGETDMTQHHFDLSLFGFGSTESTADTKSLYLQHAKTIYEAGSDCGEKLEKFNGEFQICTYPYVTCYDDFGGGLVRKNDMTQVYDVVGIASFSGAHSGEHWLNNQFCTMEFGRVGDIYTRVDAYKATIDAIVCEHSSHPPARCRTAEFHDKDIMKVTSKELPMPSTIERTAWTATVWTALTRAGRPFWGDWLI